MAKDLIVLEAELAEEQRTRLLAQAEAQELQRKIHPWYGPCDAMEDGECSECKFVSKLRWPEHISPLKQKLGL